ncbi:TB2/DP1, HVA22 family-domain-containing protein [Mycena leptocephala]|nr:TB2/DP1, HVA22 family-domain-containing protein [Mycena leptocephala]
MLFYLTSRLVRSVPPFPLSGVRVVQDAQPAPASEEDLERWLMYWSVLGCIVGVEYVAEWAICWIPLYYPMKTLFLLYLALPQTRGLLTSTPSTFTPSSLRVYIYTFLQKQVKLLWEHIGSSIGQQQGPLDSHANTYPDGAAPPPPDSSGLSGVVGSLWRSYGPGILANGAAFLRPAPATGPQRAPITMNSPAGIPPSSMRRAATQSILDRRRQLEAELAALPAVPGPSSLSSLSLPISPGSVPLTPQASPSTTYSRNSSGADLVNRSGRERTDSTGRFKFEEVEMPSDGEATAGPPRRRARAGAGKGYERVKDD